MAIELGKYGIRTNNVNPTVVLTRMGKIAWSDPKKSEPIMRRIPLGRFAGLYRIEFEERTEMKIHLDARSTKIYTQYFIIIFNFVLLPFFLETDDIANAVIFMLSDYSTMVNGTSLVVDGGFLAG